LGKTATLAQLPGIYRITHELVMPKEVSQTASDS
jgi:hypothetical protein